MGVRLDLRLYFRHQIRSSFQGPPAAARRPPSNSLRRAAEIASNCAGVTVGAATPTAATSRGAAPGSRDWRMLVRVGRAVVGPSWAGVTARPAAARAATLSVTRDVPCTVVAPASRGPTTWDDAPASDGIRATGGAGCGGLASLPTPPSDPPLDWLVLRRDGGCVNPCWEEGAVGVPGRFCSVSISDTVRSNLALRAASCCSSRPPGPPMVTMRSSPAATVVSLKSLKKRTASSSLAESLCVGVGEFWLHQPAAYLAV